MTSENDLIRRGDADGFALSLATDILPVVCAKNEVNIIQLKARIQVIISEAINAIPAVTQEPVGESYVELNINTGGFNQFVNLFVDLPDKTKLFTTPQDQSALIDRLKRVIQSYESEVNANEKLIAELESEAYQYLKQRDDLSMHTVEVYKAIDALLESSEECEFDDVAQKVAPIELWHDLEEALKDEK